MRAWIWKPVTIGLGSVLLAVGARTIIGFLPSRVYGNDFALAYVAGRVGTDRDVYAINSLNDVSDELGLPYRDKMWRVTNPPLLHWVFRRLARLQPGAAFWVWTTIETLSLAFTLLACWKLIGNRLAKFEWVLATGLTVCSMPVFANFWFGQVQLPITALVMAGLWLSRSAFACVPLTLSAALKLFPWPLVALPSFGKTGRSRYECWMLSAALLLVWAAIPGWQLWCGFFHHAPTVLNEMASGSYFNYGITSFLSSLTGPRTGRALGTIMSLVLVGAAWAWSDRALRRGLDGAEEASACLLLVATLISSVVCWTHYFVLLIYPLICLGAARQRVLLVTGLVAVNVAGSNPLAGFPQPLKLIGAYFPLFVMIALCVYFAGRLRGK